jgi:hypothetical protein
MLFITKLYVIIIPANPNKGGIFMTRALHAEVKSGERLVATDITDLTFFPRGTILTFSSEAYSATSAAFKNIWKICDGTNGTPDLVNKFLRGGTASGTTGGADNQTVNVPLKNHRHIFTGDNVQGTFGDFKAVSGDGCSGPFSVAKHTGGSHDSNSSGASRINFSMTPSGTISPEGDANPSITVSTVPSYFTVIYIMKMS